MYTRMSSIWVLSISRCPPACMLRTCDGAAGCGPPVRAGFTLPAVPPSAWRCVRCVVAVQLTGEEMQPEPRPRDEHSHPAGARAHDAREHLAERRDPGARPGGDQFDDHAGDQDEQVPGDGQIACTHRSTRNQPMTSHTASATDLPPCEASSGSVSALTVGGGWVDVVRA